MNAEEQIASLRRALKIVTFLPLPGLLFALFSGLSGLGSAHRVATSMMPSDHLHPGAALLDSSHIILGGILLLIVVALITTVRSKGWAFLYINFSTFIIAQIFFVLFSRAAIDSAKAPLELLM